jgi:hypothetical protein
MVLDELVACVAAFDLGDTNACVDAYLLTLGSSDTSRRDAAWRITESSSEYAKSRLAYAAYLADDLVTHQLLLRTSM